MSFVDEKCFPLFSVDRKSVVCYDFVQLLQFVQKRCKVVTTTQLSPIVQLGNERVFDGHMQRGMCTTLLVGGSLFYVEDDVGLGKLDQKILQELHEPVRWLLVELLVGLEGLSLANLIPEARVVIIKVVVDMEVLKLLRLFF